MTKSLYSDRFSIRFNGDQLFESIDSMPESSPLVVLLHGVMGSHTNWRSIAKRLSRELSCVVMSYDARGHGETDHFDMHIEPKGFTPEGMADDLVKILDALALKAEASGRAELARLFRSPIDLIGHSMGGRVAYHFAVKFPDRIRKLVIEDIGPVPQELRPKADKHLVERILDEVPVPFPNHEAAKAWFTSEFPLRFQAGGNASTLGPWLMTNLVANNEGITWRFQLEGVRSVVQHGRSEMTWPEWAGLNLPILLMRGERSNDLPRPVFEKLVELNPRARGLEVQGTGHWIHSEKPMVFLTEVTQFLK